MRPLCHFCKQPFRRDHRWKRIRRRFLWFRWSYRQHHNCLYPELRPAKHIKGQLDLTLIEGGEDAVIS